MSDTLLALVPVYGLAVVALATFLSCLAVPIPSSLLMLTAGAFAAVGDLDAPAVALVALLGALAGDQAGYWIARQGGVLLERAQGTQGRAAALRLRAEGLALHWGGRGVFASRWLLSPLGPYVNFAAGAARMGWPRFTLSAAAGEVIWVCLYVGLGYVFADRLQAIAGLMGNLSAALAAAGVAGGLALWLRAALRQDARLARRARRKRPPRVGKRAGRARTPS